jgi:hypothetical protein
MDTGATRQNMGRQRQIISLLQSTTSIGKDLRKKKLLANNTILL